MPDNEPTTATPEAELLAKLGPALELLRRGNGPMPKTWTADSGVVLNLKKVSTNLINEVTRRLKRPEPELLTTEHKDPTTGALTTRTFKNETSTDYTSAIEQWQLDRLAAINLVHIGRGTSLASVPDGFKGPDDDWTDELDQLFVDNPVEFMWGAVGTIQRYVQWVRNYACNDDDFEQLMSIMQGYGGLREQLVAAQMESFPGDQARGADTGADAPTVGAASGN